MEENIEENMEENIEENIEENMEENMEENIEKRWHHSRSGDLFFGNGGFILDSGAIGESFLVWGVGVGV